MSDLTQTVHNLRNKVQELATKDELRSLAHEAMEGKLDDIKANVAVIRAAVVGDLNDPARPGILVRLDRLEQSERSRSKVIWFVGSGVLALILERLRDLL